MDSKKILMILGLIFLLYLISRIISIHFVKTIPTTTTTTTKVVYRNPVGTNIHVVPPPPHPYYNPYKAQYYNSSI
jgi:hypothetical protein